MTSPIVPNTVSNGRNRLALPPRPNPQLSERHDSPRSITVEITVVFLITLGMSGLTAMVNLVETSIKAAQVGAPLSSYRVAVAAPKSTVGTVDLVYQLLSVVRGLAWGGLGLYLLWRAGFRLAHHLGLDRRRLGGDAAAGLGLAALIGIPGLGLYLVANQLGVNLTVQASTLTDVWWRPPVGALIAIQNGFLEEVLVVGYLMSRLEQLRQPLWVVLAASALLRGTYHLYQGYGGFAGNVAMGLIFGWFFLRYRRLWPLVIAHTMIDTVALVGYPLLKGNVSWLP